MNVREVLERAGADENAPEGSQAWALAQVAKSHDNLVRVLREIADKRCSGASGPIAYRMRDIARAALVPAAPGDETACETCLGTKCVATNQQDVDGNYTEIACPTCSDDSHPPALGAPDDEAVAELVIGDRSIDLCPIKPVDNEGLRARFGKGVHSLYARPLAVGNGTPVATIAGEPVVRGPYKMHYALPVQVFGGYVPKMGDDLYAHPPALGAEWTMEDAKRLVDEYGSPEAYPGRIKYMLAALNATFPQGRPAAEVGEGSFQSRVAPWMQACFGEAIAKDVRERGDRFLEEALELLQANGYDRTRVATLVDYVWGRPVGEPSQEVGGVMVTLAAYCLATGLDMHLAGETELARIWTKVEQIRAKQATKRGLHTPLPVAPPQQTPSGAGGDIGSANSKAAVEVDALRNVYECARGWMRHYGVDKERSVKYMHELEDAIDRMKEIDAGYGALHPTALAGEGGDR